MAKDKKEGAALGDPSAEKKGKKKKSVAALEAVESPAGEADTQGVANGEVERKVVLSPIAVPLADAKLRKRTLKLVKKAAQGKQLRRGVKEVVKALRKGSTG